MGPKNVSKPKGIDYVEKLPFMIIFFLYHLYIFVWIQHSCCFANMLFALDHSNSNKELVVH